MSKTAKKVKVNKVIYISIYIYIYIIYILYIYYIYMMTYWYRLEIKRIKLKNTLKNNVQLGDEINGTKGTKQLQNNKTNIEHKTACLSKLTNRGRRCRSNRKSLFSTHCCLAKVIKVK